MPFEPLQFLHATNLRLDTAIGETVKLSPHLEPIVRNATLVAFDRLIATALERRIDFLLLVGNTFVEAEHSLSARLALLDGFERLEQAAIRVFVLPGPLDPPDAWRLIPDLPANVTILDPAQKSSVAVKRGDAVVARLRTSLRQSKAKGSQSAHRQLRSESQRPVPFAIGVSVAGLNGEDSRLLESWTNGQYEADGSPQSESALQQSVDHSVEFQVDYVALGGGESRRTIAKRRGVAHDPGCAQGIGHETGPRGCTLVTVEDDGTVRYDFISTASVRWERFNISVEAGIERAELVGRCRESLQNVSWAASENAWIVDWVFRGTATSLQPLDDEAYQRQLALELSEGSGATNAVLNGEAIAHNFLMCVEPEPLETLTHGDPLQADFLAALAALRPEGTVAFAGCLAELKSIEPKWAAELHRQMPHLEINAVASHARQVLNKLCPHAVAEEVSR